MRIVIVTSRDPFPPWRGNQVRTLEWLAALAGHERLLVCPEPVGDGGPSRLAEMGVRACRYSTGLTQRVAAVAGSLLSGQPLQEGLYATASGRRTVERAVSEWRPDLVVVQMVRCGWAGDAVRRVASDLPLLFDAIDSMGLHFERASASAPGPLRQLYRREARRCRARERTLSRDAAMTTAVSARDLDAMDAIRSEVVPVSAPELPVTPIVDRSPRILLSGNLGYRPTVEGAVWFAAEIWPGVRQRVPDAVWTLAGARPSAAVRRLGSLSGVELRADVPDLAPYLASAALAVAPMASGSGVPMKVLEAWAAGVPVVGHPWMAQGLVEEARGAMVLAESPEEWRRSIIEILTDPGRSGRLADLGRRAWRRWYHPETVARSIRRAVRSAAGSPPSADRR